MDELPHRDAPLAAPPFEPVDVAAAAEVDLGPVLATQHVEDVGLGLGLVPVDLDHVIDGEMGVSGPVLGVQRVRPGHELVDRSGEVTVVVDRVFVEHRGEDLLVVAVEASRVADHAVEDLLPV